MRHVVWTVMTAMSLLAMPRTASAQYVINTAQERDQLDFYDTARWSAQMITPTLPNIAGAGFRLAFQPQLVCAPDCKAPPPLTSQITYSLWDADPSLESSTRLATATVTFTLTPFYSEWVDAFWPPVPVTVGRIYWLTIGGGSPVVKSYVLAGPPFPVYQGGDPRRGGMTEREPYTVHSSVPGREFDLTFRTFAIPDTAK
jgi:hypothetical protein